MTSDIILAFPRSCIPENWMPANGFEIPVEQEWNHFLSQVPLCWESRALLEENPTYKQPIPYVLIRNHKGEYATYTRRGSEVRLRGLLSAGIGGHVEWMDRESPEDSAWDILLHALARELNEEIALNVAVMVNPPRFVGMINEEVSATGRVHWGIVFLIDLPEETDVSPQKELYRFSWLSTREIFSMPTEHWTVLALSLIQKEFPQSRAAGKTHENLTSADLGLK